MIVLVYTDHQLGPCAVATLPDSPRARPQWFQAGPQVPSWARSQLLAKGSHMMWAEWAHTLTQTAPHAGAWSTLEVPNGWAARPDGLRRALAQARQQASLTA